MKKALIAVENYLDSYLDDISKSQGAYPLYLGKEKDTYYFLLSYKTPSLSGGIGLQQIYTYTNGIIKRDVSQKAFSFLSAYFKH